jgi:AAA domain-containing protein
MIGAGVNMGSTKRPGVSIILGVRGFGKTTLLRRLLMDRPRVVGVDPMDQFQPIAWAASQHGRIYDGLPGALPRPPRRFFASVPLDWNDPLETISDAVEAAVRAQDVTLAIDEADVHLGPTTIPAILRAAIHVGRHFGISVIVTARRAAGLPRLLTSQADRIYAFRTHEPRDKQYFRELTGEVPDGIEELPVGFYYRWRAIDGWMKFDKDGQPA